MLAPGAARTLRIILKSFLAKSLFFLQKDHSESKNTGVRISTVIPSKDWINILNNHQLNLSESSANYPLFIIDCDGMGLRGKDFDFMVNSIPGIMSKNVVWMGILDNVLPIYRISPILDILEDIQHFLDFLNNINSLVDPMIKPMNTNDKSVSDAFTGGSARSPLALNLVNLLILVG